MSVIWVSQLVFDAARCRETTWRAALAQESHSL